MVVIVFDMDGVIADATIQIIDGINYSLRALGKEEKSAEFIRDNFNVKDLPRTYGLLGVSWDDVEERERFYGLFKRYREENVADLIPQKQFLEFLIKKGARLLILSGSAREDGNAFIDKNHLRDYFSEIYLGENEKADRLFKVFEENSSERIYFIGDSVSDLMCTKEARIRGAKITFFGIVHVKLLRDRTVVPRSMSSRESFEEEMEDDGETFIIRNLTEIIRKIWEI